MNIVLIGFMGTGKSEVGRLLAQHLGWKHFDTDELIVHKAGMSIPEIFRHHGEAYFRDLETSVIRELGEHDKNVISCGGGVVLRTENMEALEKHGIVVCLTASVEAILARTKDSGRPLLAVDDPAKKIKELLAQREPYYKRCALTVDTTGINARQVTEKLFANHLIATQLT